MEVSYKFCFLIIKEIIKIGTVESIESNKKKLTEARKNTGSVSIRIKGETSIMVGRHFDESDQLISVLTRKSIDLLKEHFRTILERSDWNLVRTLKPFFGIT
jgi:translation initiation factor IF-2